jgi:type I restriction enzyme S subunit
MKKIPLLVPPPDEQTRIVEKLEELLSDLDAGVTELKAAQRKLVQYRQSLLKAAVEGALTADWRVAHGTPQETGAELLQRILSERRGRWEQKQLAKFAAQGKTPPNDWRARYPEPVAPDLTELPSLPEGWVWATVDQCAIDEDGITDGPFGSNLKSEHYTEAGPRVIRLQNIGDGRFQDARAHISEKRYQALRKHAVVEGDVVVAMLGEVLPRACAVPADIAPAIVKADCARVRLNPELVPPEFVVAALNSEPTRKRVNGLVKGIGRPRINLGNIRSIPVPLPSRVEQGQILGVLAGSLDSCDDQNLAIERGFSLSAAQRKKILKAAFAGHLVPQDPNDEPASELLARIRVERASNDGIAPRRRRKIA